MEDAALLGARHQAFDAQAEGDVHMEMAEEDEGCEDLVHLERVVPQGLSPYHCVPSCPSMSLLSYVPPFLPPFSTLSLHVV